MPYESSVSRPHVYPAKPKVVIRAIRPNQYWHIDASWTPVSRT